MTGKTQALTAAAWLTVCVGGFASVAGAHEKKTVGPFQLTIGWSDEPVFSGFRNSVEVRVADSTGAPVNDPDAQFSVEVSFGDERMTAPLRRTRDPGTYKGWVLPNRPGTYTFHITGHVKQQAIDTTSTCSDTTFDCVTDVSSIQFPAKDPSVGQLADRVSRVLPREERAVDEAISTRTIAIGAFAMAALAFVAAAVVGVRRVQ